MMHKDGVIKTDEGKALYKIWNRIHMMQCCAAWANDFMEFYNWANENGYELGVVLKRRNHQNPYSPQNCYWSANRELERKKNTYVGSQFIAKWNNTVNRFREHYGMELLDVNEPDFSDRTCKDCVHYKVCKYKNDGVPVCEDYLD